MDPLTMQAIGGVMQGAQSVQQGMIGMGMNWLDEALFGKKRRKQQLEQQGKLTDIQTAANKELADYGMGISKEMFEATGYGAQRRQMEQAGLNPALMYGSAGGGGSTSSASAGTATGGHASDEAARKQADIAQQGMALQNAMATSQIAVNKAQAKKLEAEAEKTSGVDTELNYKKIDEITQNVRGKQLQNSFDELRNDIMSDTWYDNVNQIKWNSTKSRYELELLMNQKDISDATKAATIQSYGLQVQNIAKELILKDKQINLTNEQAKSVAENVIIGYINAAANKENASKWTWQQALGNAIRESGAGGEVSKSLSEGFNAIEKLIPRDDDTLLKWLMRNW